MGLEIHRDRVYAITLIRGGAKTFALEHVPEVTAARGATNFRASVTHTLILEVNHRVFCQWLIETGPTAMRVKLGFTGE